MREARSKLEDQVGGLIGRGSHRARRREPVHESAPEPVEPQRYGLTAQATATVRATRAAGEATHRAA